MTIRTQQLGPNTHRIDFQSNSNEVTLAKLFDIIGANGWTEGERTAVSCSFSAPSHVESYTKHVLLEHDSNYLYLKVYDTTNTKEAAHCGDSTSAQKLDTGAGSLIVNVAQDRIVLLTIRESQGVKFGTSLGGFTGCFEVTNECPGEPAFSSWCFTTGDMLAGNRHAALDTTEDLSFPESPIPSVTNGSKYQCVAGPMFPGLEGKVRQYTSRSYSLPTYYSVHDTKAADYLSTGLADSSFVWPVMNFDAEPGHSYLRGRLRHLYFASQGNWFPGTIVTIHMDGTNVDENGAAVQFLALPALSRTMFFVRA